MLKVIILLFLVVWGCTKPKSDSFYLINENRIEPIFSETISDIEEVFPTSYQCRLVSLETSDSVLIGNIDQVIKFDSAYYVLTNNEILSFSLTGKYLSKLSSKGNGPNDYISISKFQICKKDSNNIIYISSINELSGYDFNSGKKIENYKYDFRFNNFSIINKDLIAFKTIDSCQMTIASWSGGIINQCLESNPNNALFRSVQFKQHEDNLIFQKGMTCNLLIYNVRNNSFEEMDLLPNNDRVATTKDVDRYTTQYGYLDAPKRIRQDFFEITDISIHDDLFVIPFVNKDISVLNIYEDGQQIKSINYNDLKNLKYEDSYIIKEPYFFNLNQCHNEEGFIYCIYSDNVEYKGLVNGEANPYLLDVSKIL